LNESFGQHFSATLIYAFPTVAEVCEHVRAELAARESAHAPASDPRVQPPAASEQPVAVIGIGCRVPGAASPNRFWRLLEEGMDAVTTATVDRVGKTQGSWSAGFLQGVSDFDAAFFRLERTAARM